MKKIDMKKQATFMGNPDKENIQLILRKYPSGKIAKYIDFLDFFKSELSEVFIQQETKAKLELFKKKIASLLGKYGSIHGKIFKNSDKNSSKNIKYPLDIYPYTSTLFFDKKSIDFFINDFSYAKNRSCGIFLDSNVGFYLSYLCFLENKPLSIDEIFEQKLGYIKGIKIAIDTSYYFNYLGKYGNIPGINPYIYLNKELFFNSGSLFFPNPLTMKITESEFYNRKLGNIGKYLNFKNTSKQKLFIFLTDYITKLEKILDQSKRYYFETKRVDTIQNILSYEGFLNPLLKKKIGKRRLNYFIEKYYSTSFNAKKDSASIFAKDKTILIFSLLNNLSKNPSLVLTRDSDFFVLGLLIKNYLSKHKNEFIDLKTGDSLFNILYESGKNKNLYYDINLE